MDRYPPLADFDVLMKWGRCGDTSANSDSASVVFRGAEQVVMHRDVEERAGFGDVFLVTYSGPSESSLRRVRADADLAGLPPATLADLRAFLRDSLGWAAPPRR